MSIAKPPLPVQKSNDLFKLYKQHGTIFGEILYQLYNDIKNGILVTGLNTESKFMTRCYKAFGQDVVFSFVNQKNYLDEQFGHAICVSTNDEVAHARPQEKYFKPGDIVSIDCGLGIPYKGHYFHLDSAFSLEIDCGSNDHWTQAPWKALRYIKFTNPRNTLELAKGITHVANTELLDVLTALTGHGIGALLHEPPVIYNAPDAFSPIRLFDNLCFCAEPIFLEPQVSHDVMNKFKKNDIYIKADNWTVATESGRASSHFETTFGVEDGQIIDLVGVSSWEL